MARVTVHVRIDNSLLNPFVARTTDRSASKAARTVAARARVRAPHRTGALAASIQPRMTRRGDVSTWEVTANAPYASFQEFGTGPIVPVRAKVLRFKPKGSNVFIFRPRTRGVPAVHFMRDAARSLTVADFCE